MPTWPSYATIVLVGEQQSQAAPVRRTAFEDGFIKQQRVASLSRVTRSLRALLDSDTALNNFRTWVAADLNGGAASFTFPDAATSTTIQARIVEGAVSYRRDTSRPSTWTAELTLEWYAPA